MIAIIDSGIANLRSVQKAFERVGHPAKVVEDPRLLREARGIVLPGVGAFADGIAKLTTAGFVEPLRREIAQGKPVLGICLGLHFLFSESEEFGRHRGLDLLPGKVVRFPAHGPAAGGTAPVPLKVPLIGWVPIRIRKAAPLLQGIPDGSHFYFVHSYYVAPADAEVVAATAAYGVPFTAVLWRGNLMATQFHPEKSQALGLRLLKNFGDLALRC
ncbi:MAG: imidazole glycerol phosphate synthase subunit HisH [candidate division NC10 bacterium]|nr:imidazole glycerol phosphate synthase subunit HisH [candidate division NC10 bacterium]